MQSKWQKTLKTNFYLKYAPNSSLNLAEIKLDVTKYFENISSFEHKKQKWLIEYEHTGT